MIIKITSKDNIVLRKGANSIVSINEHVNIPIDHYGEFYIRKSHGKQGCDTPNSIFHEGWSGTPTIVVDFNGIDNYTILKGEEIGELHIRYTPPSPLSGKQMALNYPFGFTEDDDDMFTVYTKEGLTYKVEGLKRGQDIIEWTHNDHRFNKINFMLAQAPFTPQVVMYNYTLIGPTDAGINHSLNMSLEWK